ncbi:LmeA family phospholipid-binding protein [Streptomyces sp. NPDC048270]|uniref:LmeA family phospholipid-binding protein n=1 Tax=Streptomyces sp. NPDC048270 TaxID=3154615 RepID=UPI0033EC1601
MRQRLTRIRAALRRHLVLTVTAAVVPGAVLATGAAEFTARSVLRERVATAAPALGDGVSVRAAGGLLLWDLGRGSIPHLDVSSDDARIGRLSHVRVRARLDGVRLGDRASVAGTRAQVTASPQSIAAAIRGAAPSVPVAAVTTDPAAGTVLAAVGPGGAGQLTLRPVLARGKVTLAVEGFTVFGRSVPTARLGLGEGGLGAEAGGRDYPLGLTATSVQVRPDGVHVALTGGPGALPGT